MTVAQTYYEATSSSYSARPQLSHDLDTEVCIIGGGFAGLWTARALQRRKKDVVVVERNRIAGAASGRNGGFVSSGFNKDLAAIVDRVGLDHARSLYRLSRMGVDIVREETAYGLPGVNMVPGYLHVSCGENSDAAKRESEWYAREFSHDLEFWSTERVREALKTNYYHYGLHDPDAFHIHPLNLAIALAEDIERRGGKIYEDTTVVSADVDGVRKIVRTPRGTIRAEHVVFAANELPEGNFPELSRTVVPIATYLCATRPAGPKLAEIIRYTGCVQDDRRLFNYYRAAGDRLIWGGGISTNLKRPANLEQYFEARINAVFPQLSGIGIEHAWTGTMGFTIHRMPQIGMLRPGAWIASAFGGQGLNTTAMAGELIASAIVEKDDRWRLFIPFGLVWAGGWLGKVYAQANWWSRGLRDRIDDVRRSKKKAA